MAVEPSILINRSILMLKSIFFFAETIVKIIIEKRCMNMIMAHDRAQNDFDFHVTLFILPSCHYYGNCKKMGKV